MLRSGTFWIGVIAGIAGLYAYHAFIKPVPSTKS
jgi:hypothetical protein